MRKDRRNQGSLGRKRRRDFDQSVHHLRGLGMPDWAVEYYRRAARVVGLSPHMVVCHVAVVAAGRQLRGKLQELEAEAGIPAPAVEAPSYESVKKMRRRVADLWQEIERHGSLLNIARQADAAAALTEEASSIRFPAKLTIVPDEPAAPTNAPARPRRRKTPSKGH